MRRCNQVTSVLFFIFAVIVIIQSRKLVYAVEFTPGAGFFPFWLGIILAISSLILLVRNTILRVGETGESTLPSKHSIFRIMLVLSSFFFSIMVFERIGFLISMFFFISFLLIVLEKYRWYYGLLISLGMVSAAYGIFKMGLGISLPPGLLG